MARSVLEVPLSKVSPAYLHSNSTSHTWVFSAIAELVDNAYDPDVSATELWIDRAKIGGKQCLTIEDNGLGMDYNRLHHMLSFGFCEKAEFDAKKHKAIGKYGNGFKSGSMRLGKDALVFTVCDSSASVGFLSQTYLLETKADSVRVPMIEYSLPRLDMVSPSAESRAMLDIIFEFSPYTEESGIRKEFEQLRKHPRNGTGTKIVLFNLKRHKNSLLELDFDSDPQDIRNPEVHEVDTSTEWSQETQNETSKYVSSLRHYCSILYLKPRMKIYICGVKVKTMLISESLSSTGKDNYKPPWLETQLGITFGFFPHNVSNNTDEFGVMFYHRNRLIKAFQKVGYQKQPNELGVGVVGVVHDADFLTPTHNKQDFIKDEKYNSLLAALDRKLNRYWDAKKGQSGSGERLSTAVADWNWANCDKCNKWRRLLDSMRGVELPDKWYCHMNRDPLHNRCEIPEESHLEGEFTCTSPKVKAVSTRKRKSKSMEVLEAKKAEVEAKAAELAAKVAELEETERKRRKTEPSPRNATSGKQNSTDSSAPSMATASSVSNAGMRSNPLDLRTSAQPFDRRGGTSGQGQTINVRGTGSSHAAANAKSDILMSICGAAVNTTTYTRGVTTSLPVHKSPVTNCTTTADLPASLRLPAAICQTSDQLQRNAKLVSRIVRENSAIYNVPDQVDQAISGGSQVGLSEWEIKYALLQEQNKKLAEEKEKLFQEKTTIAVEKEGLIQASKKMAEEKEQLFQANKKMAEENEELLHANKKIAEEKEKLSQANKKMAEENEALLHANKKIAEEKEKLFQANKKMAEEIGDLLQANKKMAEEKQELLRANNKIVEEKEQLFQANKKMTKEKKKVVQEKNNIEEQKEETERRFLAIERRFISMRCDIHSLLNHTISGFSCQEEEVEQAVKDIIEENCS